VKEAKISKLKELVKKLLDDKTVNLVIGYSEGMQGEPRPLFAATSGMADKVIFNEKCKQNLVAYLHKPEIKAFGKIGIVCTFPALRALLQIYAENQFKNFTVIPIAVHADGNPEVMMDVKQIEEYVQKNYAKSNQQELDTIAEILNKSIDERWDYWVDAVHDCVKCYACRSACPMCYCEKCTTDCNQPQWVQSSAHVLGNVEWHVMRAMHLAGRCVNCNECARVCPMDIPLNLLTRKLNEDIEAQFGQVSGMSATLDYAMSSYKFEDKENFIR